LQGNFRLAIVGSVIELLEVREEQGFDRADLFLPFYGVKFEVLQRSLPVREFQLAVGHGVSLSLSAGEMPGAASAVRLDDQLSSGLLVEEAVLAGGTRGDLRDLLVGVFDGGCRANPEHCAVFYLENIEPRTCHLYPRFTSFTDRDFV
jgi:hypothetical protein